MTAEGFRSPILEEIGDKQYDVIIVDPLYKILNGADANATGEMQMILAELEHDCYEGECRARLRGPLLQKAIKPRRHPLIELVGVE